MDHTVHRIDIDGAIDTIGDRQLSVYEAKDSDRANEHRHHPQATFQTSHPHHLFDALGILWVADHVAYRLQMGQYAICAAVSVNRLLIQGRERNLIRL